MERKVELQHFLLGGYTIGFIGGSFGTLLTKINTTINLSFSFESIVCILIALPIVYWVYRYSGMVFNDQTMRMKFLYSIVLIVGLFMGIIFSELLFI